MNLGYNEDHTTINKLIDFFRRNTGRKPSIMKAWKRGEGEQLLGPSFSQEAREDEQKKATIDPKKWIFKATQAENEAGETQNSSILRL